MQTSDPEIQFGPIPEGMESDSSVQDVTVPVNGDRDATSTPLMNLEGEREEIKQMKRENEGLRRQLQALKNNNLFAPIYSPSSLPTGRTEQGEVPKPVYSSFTDKPRVRPATFDGTGSWNDYRVQFELLAELNGWAETSKAIYLAASLRGPAQSVLGDLDEDRRRSYSALTAALGQRFGPENQTELFRVQLKNRLRRKDETLPELAQAIRRLTRQAYPSANYQLQETLSKEHFIDALNDTDIRWRVFQSRPSSLEDAVRVAVELEAFQVADRQRVWSRKPTARVINADNDSRMKTTGEQCNVQEQMASFAAQIEKILTDGFKNLQKHTPDSKGQNPTGQIVQRTQKFDRTDNYGPTKCWNCGMLGHLRKNCPHPVRRSFDSPQSRQPFRQGNGQQSDCRANVRLNQPGPTVNRRP